MIPHLYDSIVYEKFTGLPCTRLRKNQLREGGRRGERMEEVEENNVLLSFREKSNRNDFISSCLIGKDKCKHVN